MKAVSDTYMDESEEVARAGNRAMKEFLAYEGTNKDYYLRAKVGATAAANYVRLRATETNRMAVEQQALRETGVAQPALPVGEGRALLARAGKGNGRG